MLPSPGQEPKVTRCETHFLHELLKEKELLRELRAETPLIGTDERDRI